MVITSRGSTKNHVAEQVWVKILIDSVCHRAMQGRDIESTMNRMEIEIPWNDIESLYSNDID